MRNLPCFTFSIFSMNVLPSLALFQFTPILLFRSASCEALLSFIKVCIISWTCPLFDFRFSVSRKRGGKVKKLFLFSKSFLIFFHFIFQTTDPRFPLSLLTQYSFYSKPVISLLPISHSFQWTRFCFSGCKGNRLFLSSKTFLIFFQSFSLISENLIVTYDQITFRSWKK